MADRYRPVSRAREYAPPDRNNDRDRYEPPPPPPPPYGGYQDQVMPPPPPPPPPPGPGPPGPPGPGTMRRFGEDRDRDRDAREARDARDARDTFDFSAGPSRGYPSYPSYPSYPAGGDRVSAGDLYRPSSAAADQAARRRRDMRDERDARGRRPLPRDRDRDRDRGYGNRYDNYNRPRGRPFKKLGASERALLRFDRGTTPPQLEGMNNGSNAGAKYLDFDDLSDVEEQDMDQSSAEEEEEEEEEKSKEPAPPPKPKWSNAELYTALPPPDESQRNKKDMVKLIRRARIQQKEAEEDKIAVSTGDDFISLDMAGDDSDKEEELIIPVAPVVPGAPSGPRAEREDLINSDASKVDTPTAPLAADATAASRLNSLKRKRPVEDDGDDLLSGFIQPPTKSLKRGGKPSGSLLFEWQLVGTPKALLNEKAIPWRNQGTCDLPASKSRLHLEIVDFYRFVQPKNYERKAREDLLHRLELFMKRVEPRLDCQVKCFGSFALGIYLPDADMDVTILSRDFRSRGVKMLGQSTNKMWKLARRMMDDGFAEDIEVIPKAKVPIIKIIDRQTSLKVDISFENPSGLEAIETFEKWKLKYPAMPILVTLIKQFLLMRGLNDVAVGGLGGFAVTCLVTSLLQHHPRVQSGELVPEQHLGEMLIEFLKFYGRDFDRYNTAIRMEPPALLPKGPIISHGPIPKARPERLMIIDPNNGKNDISGGSADVDLIFHKFRKAEIELNRVLLPDKLLNRPSLLDWMFGGNYDPFLWYRRKLKQLHEKKWGPVPPEDTDFP